MTTDIVSNFCGDLLDVSVRHKIEALENEFLKLPQVEIPVIHRWSGGIYVREITIPKDTILTGRIYLDDHFDIMVSGDVTVSSNDGLKRLQGFHIFEGLMGKKRAGYTHQETRWITMCICPEMPDDEYIDYITVTSFSEFDQRLMDRGTIDESEIKEAFHSQRSFRKSDYDGFKSGYLTASGKKLRSDYDQMLLNIGVTEEIVRRESENTHDMDLRITCNKVTIRQSNIQGKGLFATCDISADTVIMPSRFNGKRTIAGRYVNHSNTPNAKMMMNGDNMSLVSIHVIREGDEITTNYRDTLIEKGELKCQAHTPQLQQVL